MSYMVIISWCNKGSSSVASSSNKGGGGVNSGRVSRRHGGRPSSSGIERFVRKLKKRSKMLCMVPRTPSFHCQYDPLSYSRNFDRTGFGTSDDDHDLDHDHDDHHYHFCHSFSSRFAMASSSFPREEIASS
ncbi:hypothetical protein J5N97_009077 [Dioscorea zingiberensis]|uniref:Uncharacterized protein n=1 Tax=Dioscorea zingiberensis TaxID=325984 RepID=A0A9D5HLZ2_9LILI|nr:hypothetical protein J5N97_009077 [Dioscorea zingiberensis]